MPNDGPVIIEAAINGATPKSRNSHVPRSVDEIVVDAVACVDAGAAIVHNHNDDPVLGTAPSHDPQPYIDSWREILAQRPGTILYPTMGGGGSHTTIEQRYSHILALAEAAVLGQGLVDPGCVAFGGTDPDGLPADADIVYRNTYADARYMFASCSAMGHGASISCFEPGFVRVALAYQRAGKLPPGSLVKLYFGAGGAASSDDGAYPLAFGLPPTEASLDAYCALMGPGIENWSVAALGGNVIESGLARLALERGGHVRVGLEDHSGQRQPSNVELVGELVALCAEVGRPVATAAEARSILGLPAAD